MLVTETFKGYGVRTGFSHKQDNFNIIVLVRFRVSILCIYAKDFSYQKQSDTLGFYKHFSETFFGTHIYNSLSFTLPSCMLHEFNYRMCDTLILSNMKYFQVCVFFIILFNHTAIGIKLNEVQ